MKRNFEGKEIISEGAYEVLTRFGVYGLAEVMTAGIDENKLVNIARISSLDDLPTEELEARYSESMVRNLDGFPRLSPEDLQELMENGTIDHAAKTLMAHVRDGGSAVELMENRHEVLEILAPIYDFVRSSGEKVPLTHGFMHPRANAAGEMPRPYVLAATPEAIDIHKMSFEKGGISAGYVEGQFSGSLYVGEGAFGNDIHPVEGFVYRNALLLKSKGDGLVLFGQGIETDKSSWYVSKNGAPDKNGSGNIDLHIDDLFDLEEFSE